MGEAKKRKVHTAEFKAKVGLEAVRGVKTISEPAARWENHGAAPTSCSEGNGHSLNSLKKLS